MSDDVSWFQAKDGDWYPEGDEGRPMVMDARITRLSAPHVQMFRLTYESHPGMLTVWEKTMEELLVPNGPEDTLLDWMMRQVVARRGKTFTLEMIP